MARYTIIYFLFSMVALTVLSIGVSPLGAAAEGAGATPGGDTPPSSVAAHKLSAAVENGGGEVAAANAPTAAELPWQLAIVPFLTPVIIGGVKALAPKIPSAWLPVIAAVLGFALDLAHSLLTGAASNPWVGAGLGLAGVGVFEFKKQVGQLT